VKSIISGLSGAGRRLPQAVLAFAVVAGSVAAPAAQPPAAQPPASAIVSTASQGATAADTAERFVSAINTANGSALHALIDVDALAARVIRNLDFNAVDRARHQARLGAEYLLLGYSVSAQMAAQQATASLLRSSSSDRGGEFLVRITTRDAKDNLAHGYLQVELDPDGRIVDWYDHSLALSMSGQLAFYASGMLSTTQIVQLLVGDVDDATATALSMRKFATLVASGNKASVHAGLLTMPDAITKRREFATLKVDMARHVGMDAYRDAMAELARQHGDADDLQFILIDHYLLSDEPERALQAIDRAARVIGNDEVMETNRCHALLDLGRKADALAACDRAIARDPAFETPRWTRVRLALKTQDAALAIASLSGVEQAQGSRLDAGKLAKNKSYAWLVKQPEFAAWGAQRGWTQPDEAK